MHEDELKTVNYEEEYEPMLPDGWSEGDDFFKPSSWSGASDQSGQTEETASELEQIAAEMETTEEVPTTDEPAEETEGQSAEEPNEETESGQTEEPTKPSRILKLKFNHEDQEVDINTMADEELITALQKAKAFDAMKDDQMKAKYREIYERELAAGMTELNAEMTAAYACGGKVYPLKDDSAEPTAPEAPVARPTEPIRDFVSEVTQLKSLYPNFKEMPDEVARAVANGANLLTAYVAYREKQTSKAAESLKRENEVLKQNAASAAKAPVRGITGGGATDTKPKNNLLAGFDSDYW